MEENNYTLEEMRADYQALKDTLARQEIITDKMLRDLMKGKVRSIKSIAMVSVTCGIFVVIMAPIVFHYNPVIRASWAFVIFTDLLMIGSIFMTWYFHRKVQGTNIANCDLLTFSKEVKALKENYRKWLRWCIIPMLLFVAWLCIEVWLNAEYPKLAIAMIAGLVVGAVVGGIIGFFLDKKIINTCDEIITNIQNN